MSNRNLTNVAASVHARLMNRSRQTGETLQFLLQRYAAERFLYRLGLSPQRDRFVLKGAMVFALWGGSVYRATRDLDFTGYGDPSEETVLQCFREICAQAGEDDGVEFDTSTIRVEPISDEAEYNGVRVRFEARLGGARISMQVDVGFGNAIEPAARDEEYPTLLGGPAPRIRAYPVEAVVAEKLHAIHRFGMTNSRLKDFYDLYVLSEQFEFDAEFLQRAVAATFERRGTPIVSTLPAGLQPRFFADDARAGQWRAYLSRSGLPGAPFDFQVVGERLRAFLGPIWDGLANGWSANGTWRHGNGWSFGETGSGAAKVPGTAVESIAQVTAPAVITAKDAVAATSTSLIERPATTGLGRFKPYPAYKDSGVEWLGPIPAHWEVKPLKFTVSMNPDVLDEATRPDYEMLYVDVGNVDSIGTIQNAESVRFVNAPTRARRKVRTGDTILSTVRTYLKAIAFVNDPPDNLIVSTGFAVLRPGRNVDPKFLWRLVQSQQFVDAVVSYSEGVGYPAINPSRLGRLVVWLPPLPEQRAIAAFLDRETAKIDALVEKKERLIALLQEKRTALISHAVTKGLDPSVPVKDSGVEWLGAIPAHWEVFAVKRLAKRIQTGTTPPTAEADYYEYGGVPWYGPGSFADDLPLQAPAKHLTEKAVQDGVATVFESNTVAIVTIGATIGKVALLERAGSFNQQITGVTLKEQYVDAKYGAYQLKRLEPVIHGIAPNTTLPIFDQEEVGHLPFVVPPHMEQRAIAAFLDRETAKIDALIAKVREVIERLKEYRTALISAAVTGKIDVRELGSENLQEVRP
jgi:type I restriction enzyme S subunit